jgi:integrase
MSVYWSKQHKRWRFEFDRYIQGQRHRAGKLLPKGWSQAEADAFDRTESARLYAIAAGVRDDDPLIETAVAMYLADKEGLKSHKTATEHLAAILPAYAGRRMSDLPNIADDIDRKRARADGRGALSDATVRQRIALLKAACRWAWKRHGLTKHDPTTRMILPAVSNERRHYLTRKQMLQVCRACTNWPAQIAIRVAFYTGMRLGEIRRAVPAGDVLVLEETKNGDRRMVPVHPKIAHLTRFLPLATPKITVQRAAWRAFRAVGLAGITFHDLRHSAASELVNNGVSPHLIGELLGHRDSRSTRRYSHASKETMQSVVNRIGGKRAA